MKTVTAEIEVEVPADVVYDAIIESFKDSRFRSLYRKKMGWELEAEIMEDRGKGLIGLLIPARLFPFKKKVGGVYCHICVRKTDVERTVVSIRYSWGGWLDWLFGSGAIRCQAINCALDGIQTCVSLEVAYRAGKAAPLLASTPLPQPGNPP